MNIMPIEKQLTTWKRSLVSQGEINQFFSFKVLLRKTKHNGCGRINGGLTILSISLSVFILSECTFFQKIQLSILYKTIYSNGRQRGKSKKVIVLILRTCYINNFQAQNTVFLYLRVLMSSYVDK